MLWFTWNRFSGVVFLLYFGKARVIVAIGGLELYFALVVHHEVGVGPGQGSNGCIASSTPAPSGLRMVPQ